MDTPDILFQYLKDILYHTEQAELDLAALPPEFEKFGRGMQLLGQWVKETKGLSSSMAKGSLAYSEVDRENVLAGPLKELQSTLRHVTWQTEQVAKGDYSQTLDFMGDFSAAFNTMTRQLEERREALLWEKQQAEAKNAALEQAFDLVKAFADCSQNMIFIDSIDGQRALFRNKSAQGFLEGKTEESGLLLGRLREKEHEKIDSNVVWETSLQTDNGLGEYIYFIIESYPIEWKGQRAIVHVLMDETERRKKENLMYQLAYGDTLTGLYNLRYAMERMGEWMQQGTPFVLAYIDVDYLKYYNDTYGHRAGDKYLLKISRALETLGGVLCRTGGDEFMVLDTEKTAEEQNRALEKVRGAISEEGRNSSCPQSFSYAACQVPSNPEKTLEEYIALADAKMYQYKTKWKSQRKDLFYRDDRLELADRPEE